MAPRLMGNLAMFQTSNTPIRSKRLSLLASFLLHCIVLYVLLHCAPVFVKPYLVAWGQHGKNETVTYSPQPAEQKVTKKRQVQFKSKQTVSRKNVLPVELAKSGTGKGSSFQGFATGRNAVPALPQVFPDPVIYPWQLSGIQGDVIVEVTIDSQGSVTETRLLQSLKQEIDDKVIATVRNWRFKPATVDGVAITSRQDVYFHFPS